MVDPRFRPATNRPDTPEVSVIIPCKGHPDALLHLLRPHQRRLQPRAQLRDLTAEVLHEVRPTRTASPTLATHAILTVLIEGRRTSVSYR